MSPTKLTILAVYSWNLRYACFGLLVNSSAAKTGQISKILNANVDPLSHSRKIQFLKKLFFPYSFLLPIPRIGLAVYYLNLCNLRRWDIVIISTIKPTQLKGIHSCVWMWYPSIKEQKRWKTLPWRLRVKECVKHGEESSATFWAGATSITWEKKKNFWSRTWKGNISEEGLAITMSKVGRTRQVVIPSWFRSRLKRF